MFIAETSELKDYPNPFERNFTAEPNESEELDVTVVGLTGRELVKARAIDQPTHLVI